jgi:SgrR family transcriptional regulator
MSDDESEGLLMQLTHYYLQLRTSFEPRVEGDPQRVTLEELAALLFCTTRNVKLLLKRMSELGWIKWEPGRGRGNASELTFLVPAGDMISKEAVELARKGDFKGAMELINRYGDRYPLRESFVEWLFSYFGYKAEEKEERRLDSLRFPLFLKIQTLDPIHAYFAGDVHLVDNVFDTLVRFNTATKSIEPRLAHYWETNADRTSWTFYLRKGVMFHHGREMTAYDVKFSLQRLSDPANNSTHRWIVSGIRDIVVLNRTTLRIELKRPNYMFLQHLSECCTSIVPEEICREHGELFSRLPVGTGAFRVDYHDEYVCRLRAFDGYYGERPHLDQVELWVLPEHMPGWALRKEPQIVPFNCGFKGFTPSPLEFLPEEPGWERREEMVPGCSLITFNLQAPGPQRHAKFREAVDLVIDREALVRELYGSRSRPARSFLDYGAAAEEPPAYPADTEKARKLLQEIGYDGWPLRVYTCRSDPQDLFWIRDRCLAVGINLDIHTLSRDEIMKPQRMAEADMIHYSVVLEELEFTMLGILLQSNSFVGAHLSSDLKRFVTEEVERIQQQPKEEVRFVMLQELERRLKEQRAFLFLQQYSYEVAYHESLKGVTVNALGWVDFRKLFFTQTQADRAPEEARPIVS